MGWVQILNEKPQNSIRIEILGIERRSKNAKQSHEVCRGCALSLKLAIAKWRLCNNNVVARDGVEPPTPAFSGLRSTT
jgi:hypothetical protein